jgi:phosphoribosyl 1,2-cyclic phosphodiesterase
MGFPFLAPALSGGYSVHIYGVHPDLRGRFEAQMDRVHFPITLEEMRSEIFFHQIRSEEEITLGPFRIGNKGLHHPGGSWAYRVSAQGKSVVFATDGEYRERTDESLAPFVDFYRGTDLLIFDAMYPTLEQTIEKEDYGHSTAVIGVDLALHAGVKILALFHHDPESDDRQITDSLLRARQYLDLVRDQFPGCALQIVAAFDGMVIEV